METNDVDKVCAKCDTIIEAVTCAQVRRSERVPERILALCIRNVPVTLETRWSLRISIRRVVRGDSVGPLCPHLTVVAVGHIGLTSDSFGISAYSPPFRSSAPACTCVLFVCVKRPTLN